MKSFTYRITNSIGIHARPAGLLVKEAKKFASRAVLHKGEKYADLTRLIALMSLGVTCGEEVTVTVEGADEDAACDALELFFHEHL